MKKIIIISLIFFGVSFFAVSHALTINNPLASDDVADIISSIWKFVYLLAIAVVPLMAIIAGFMFMTAGGDSTKINKAKDLLLWLVIGVVIVLLAGGIVQLIRKIMGI